MAFSGRILARARVPRRARFVRLRQFLEVTGIGRAPAPRKRTRSSRKLGKKGLRGRHRAVRSVANSTVQLEKVDFVRKSELVA